MPALLPLLLTMVNESFERMRGVSSSRFTFNLGIGWRLGGSEVLPRKIHLALKTKAQSLFAIPLPFAIKRRRDQAAMKSD